MKILLLVANLRWSGGEGALLVTIAQWRTNRSRPIGGALLHPRHGKKWPG
jgi:hypothetical protein